MLLDAALAQLRATVRCGAGAYFGGCKQGIGVAAQDSEFVNKVVRIERWRGPSAGGKWEEIARQALSLHGFRTVLSP
jgi:hypothetical protein